MPPFSGAGLANCVLIAEQTSLVEGVGGVYGVKPLHAHELFSLFWTETLFSLFWTETLFRLPKQLALPFHLPSPEAMSFALGRCLSGSTV